MIYIPEKEEIIRNNKWTTDYSKRFFRYQKRNCNKYMIFGNGLSSHGFVVDETGELFGFGKNNHYQLGLGDKKHKLKLTPIKFFSSKKIIKICCGVRHSIFLVEDNQVYSTGSNRFGQLGLKNYRTRSIPCIVNFKEFDVLDVFVGYLHTVVLSKTLEAFSFGDNRYGQLGVGKRIDKGKRNSATKVILSEKIISISCGGVFTFFMTIKGNIFVCGDNSNRVGLRINHSSSAVIGYQFDCYPVEIPTIIRSFAFKMSDIVQIGCGDSFALFLTKYNQVFASGSNYYGQWGIKDFTSITYPASVQLNWHDGEIFYLVSSLKIEKVISIKCGRFHSYFRSKGKIWRTGNNEYGQLSTGNCENLLSPKLFEIEGKKIIQSLLLKKSSFHFTKNEVHTLKTINYVPEFN